MTLLVGDSNQTAYTGAGPTSTDGGYLAPAPFIASTNGVLSTLNAWITPGTATSFQMGLYDGVLQRLAASPTVPVTTPQLVSFPINAPVVAGRAYQILLAPVGAGTYQFGVDGTLTTQAFKVANGGGLPFQLGGPVTTAFGAPAFWADGDAQAQVLAASGTNQTLFDVATIFARAFSRCRLPSTKISDELIQVAKDELYLLLVGLANGPTPLWAIETDLFPFTQGQSALALPFSTVDVKNVNYRQLSTLQSSAATTYAPVAATQVTTVSVTVSGPTPSFKILMGAQILLSVTSPNLALGQTAFYDLPGAIPATSWSVSGGNFSNISFYNAQYEIPMYPFSRDEWSYLPNRAFPGTPRQFWFERTTPPTIHFWPVPQLADQSSACLVIFRHRHIQDVGALTNRIDCPPRWLPAIVDGLAESLARHPSIDPQVLPMVTAYAAKSLAAAKGEERENAPMKIVPQIRGYTR